jgi:hypothetical protein
VLRSEAGSGLAVPKFEFELFVVVCRDIGQRGKNIHQIWVGKRPSSVHFVLHVDLNPSVCKSPFVGRKEGLR